MLFVTGSDAPLYHYPITTVSLIVVNTLIHIGTLALAPEAIVPWCLAYGDGLHPLQWISCNFLHAGWGHLIGNMLFLWPFGLLVEGKLGWWRMLLLCLAICVLHSSSQQLLMLSSNYGDDAASLSRQFDGNAEWEAMSEDEREAVIEGLRQGMLVNGYGRSLGASCLVFGLLAVCAVWAPVNEFDVVSRWGAYEWPVLTVAAVFIVKEFLSSLLVGGAISTPMLHMFGAVAGFALGLSMLVVGMVDCEGYDLVSHVTGEKFEPWTVKELLPGHAKREATEKNKQAELEAAKAAATVEAARPKWQVAAPTAATSSAGVADWLGVTRETLRPSGPTKTPAARTHPSPAVDRAKKQNDPLFGASDSQLASNEGSNWLDSMELPEVQKPEELIESAIVLGDFSGALRQLSATIRADREFKPGPTILNRLAEGLIESQQADSALKVLAFAISRHPTYANRWKMRSARVLLTICKNPDAAMEMLKTVNRLELDDAGRQKLAAMIQASTMASQSKG